MSKPQPTQPIQKGQRVFTCGHSFHAWTSSFLVELARSAGIEGHELVGVSSIGGSRAIDHWDVPDEQNEAKKALRAGRVDVLTLSCMSGPDDGIGKLARLAFEHNPDVRVNLQELWLPEDRFPFDHLNRVRKTVEEFNGSTLADLKKPHAAYFKAMEDYATAVNRELGKQVIFIVPDAQATMALRGRIIAGTVPGLIEQSDLFTDPWGHPTRPLQLLAAYTNFSVIYRRSPLGLPIPSPAVFPEWSSERREWRSDELNRILQELAWSAAVQHRMSGVA